VLAFDRVARRIQPRREAKRGRPNYFDILSTVIDAPAIEVLSDTTQLRLITQRDDIACAATVLVASHSLPAPIRLVAEIAGIRTQGRTRVATYHHFFEEHPIGTNGDLEVAGQP
jgi:hypothetical protein